MSVISNTTVIVNFAAIGQLELLRQLFGVLYLPTEVYAEIRDGQAEGYTYLNGIEDAIAPLTADGWLHLASMHDCNHQDIKLVRFVLRRDTYSEFATKLRSLAT